MRRQLRWYGASPLHLLALLACFGLAGYAAEREPPRRRNARPRCPPTLALLLRAAPRPVPVTLTRPALTRPHLARDNRQPPWRNGSRRSGNRNRVQAKIRQPRGTPARTRPDPRLDGRGPLRKSRTRLVPSSLRPPAHSAK